MRGYTALRSSLKGWRLRNGRGGPCLGNCKSALIISVEKSLPCGNYGSSY